MKENLNRAVSGEVDDCLDLEVRIMFIVDKQKTKNATKAFVEKTTSV